MLVRIGVLHTPKELNIELPDDADQDQVRADIEHGIAAGGMVWLTDRRGRRVGVPADRIGYVDLGTSDSEQRIGFGT